MSPFPSKWVNLYNPDDIATSFAWELNNITKHYLNRDLPEEPDPVNWSDWAFDETLIPPVEIWQWRYVIEVDQDGKNHYYRVAYTVEGEWGGVQEEITDDLVDASGRPGTAAYEIIAFLSQANAPVVGTKIVDWFGANNVDIQDFGLLVGSVNTSSPLFAGARQNHGFQFHHDAATTQQFWSEVKERTGFDATY